MGEPAEIKLTKKIKAPVEKVLEAISNGRNRAEWAGYSHGQINFLKYPDLTVEAKPDYIINEYSEWYKNILNGLAKHLKKNP